jgi:hypothetical protein
MQRLKVKCGFESHISVTIMYVLFAKEMSPLDGLTLRFLTFIPYVLF